MRIRLFAALCIGTLLCLGNFANADQSADKAMIEKAVESYTAAFNAGDAKALAGHWGKDAVYTNPITGDQVTGRSAIEEQFTGILAGVKGAKLMVEVESIDFISPSVAVEVGSAKLIHAEGDPAESTYSAVHVKSDGKWHLDRVTEEDVPVVRSNYEHLKSLEWIIGSWVDDDGQVSINTTCTWTKNQNFITRSFTISTADRVDMSGIQIIGWDPATKKIRSWVFDSDGGFAEGEWTNKGDSWYITVSGVLHDGKTASSINVISKVDDNQFKWQSINRTVAGKLLPNVDEVVVVRSSSAE